MNDTKLIQLLATFSRKERLAFQDFARSPYFNKNSTVVGLLDYIIKYAPSFTSSQFTTKNAIRKLNLENDKNKFNGLLNKLMKLAEMFLAHEALKQDTTQANFYSLSYLLDHQLNPLYESYARKFERKVEREAQIDVQSYWNYQAEKLRSRFLIEQKDDGTGDVNRLKEDHYLDLFYSISRLKQYCIILNRRRISTFDASSLNIRELDKLIEASNLQQHPFVKIWYTTLQLLRFNKKEDYFSLKTNLANVNGQYPSGELKAIYTFLENSTPYVFDRSERYKEYFDLLDQQKKANILVTNDWINPTSFRNIVTVALVLGKIDWAQDFIKEYDEFLPVDHPDSRDSMRYCQAQLDFKQSKFEDCLDQLNEVEGKNIYMKLNERRMRMKVYFELHWAHQFEDLVNSFRKFLSERKETIPEKHLQGHRDFINHAWAIFKLIKGDDSKIQKLEDQLKDIPFLPDKNWLSQKLNLLK